MPLSPCTVSAAGSAWVCNLNTTACFDDGNIFPLAGGKNFILRDYQVAGIESGNNGSALEVSATTNLTCAAVATVTAPAKGQHYRAGNIAGAVAGTGVPLLVALMGALFYIYRQRRELQQQKERMLALPPQQQYPQSAQYQQPSLLDSAAVHEMYTTAAEMYTGGEAHELDSKSRGNDSS